MKGAAKKITVGKDNGKLAPPTTSPDEKQRRLLCAVTSEELATVIGTLVGELEFARTTEDSKAREKASATALAAAERALSLARSLRYFSIHSSLEFTTTDISQVVLDAIELVEKELILSAIKLSVTVEESTFGSVDPSAIQQIILNVVAHARQSMPGGGQLTLSLAQKAGHLEITCTDNGLGLPELAPETNPQTEPPEGGPLNLSVATTFVRAHGGEIEIKSSPGVGTTVLIQLPIAKSPLRPIAFPEGRRSRRVNLSLPVVVRLGNSQIEIQTQMTTLSAGGCFAKFNQPVAGPLPEVNAPVSLRIHYFGNEVLDIPRGRIASVSGAGNGSGMGIEFLNLDGLARKVIEALVKSHTG